MSDLATPTPPTAPPVVTIDGPSGTGKGTLRTRLAAWLGYHMLDSGALYRALAHKVIAAGIDLGRPADSAARIAALAADMDVVFRPATDDTGVAVVVEGTDVTADVRSEHCGNVASLIAALPEVRAALLAKQREARRPPGLVADGRDMGTVVFPDAAFKLFLTATPEERARRRHKQLIEKGNDVNLARLFADITARDRRDSERTEAPLAAADDAVELDTSGLTIDAVTRRVKEMLVNHGLSPSPA